MNTVPGDPMQEAVRGASDPARVQERLAAWFAARGRPEVVESVAIDRVFYVPGSEFTAVYAVTLGAALEVHGGASAPPPARMEAMAMRFADAAPPTPPAK